MRHVISISAAWILILLLGFTHDAQATPPTPGGGCPNHPSPAVATEYKVLRFVELAKAIPETASAEVPQHFREVYIEDVDHKPDEVVLLSSTPDGRGATCSDDLVRIQTSAGLIFEHDYRSPDRNSILSLEPINVSDMFVAGSNRLKLTLTDLTPDRYSSSPYYLVWVETPASPPPVAEIFTAIPPTPDPTSTPTPRPTATSTVIPTSTPTFTTIARPSPAPPASAPPQLPLPITFLSRNVFLGLALLAAATTLALLVRRISNRPRLAGILEITRDGEFWKTVDLSAYGQEVTIGCEGKIVLEDDEDSPTIPPVAARLIAQRGSHGTIQVIWQNLEDIADVEAASHQLDHGDVEIIGPYRLTYENFGQSERAEDLLDGGIWNEI